MPYILSAEFDEMSLALLFESIKIRMKKIYDIPLFSKSITHITWWCQENMWNAQMEIYHKIYRILNKFDS